ncbi:Polyphosphate kinase [bacterium HR33]|nr:Polyphosphate kinase [bacterium HR33]
MTVSRARARIRFDLGTEPALIERLLREPLPLGYQAGPAARSFFRDIYFDTPDGELRRRRITCRLRVQLDDRRLLGIKIQTPTGAELYEAAVSEIEPARILSGTSEPARRLQAIVDPGRLSPVMELVTERRLRYARRPWSPLPAFLLLYDSVKVQARSDSAEFHELTVEQRWCRRETLYRFGTALEAAHGLHRIAVSRLEWAERQLQEVESARLAREVQGEKAVTVIGLQGGRIALVRGEDGLRLPRGSGGGEEACREMMRRFFGSSEGQLLLLGVVPATATHPAVEVWLARRLRRNLGDGGSIQWFSPAEIISRVGSPVLRDPVTLAALTVAARSQLMPEWTTAISEEVVPSPDSDPDVVAASRRTLAELRVPILPDELLDASKPSPEQFLNPELSWIEFNSRVLALAEDPGVPLLERVRFLAIVSTNLDEFFSVKVGGLKRAVAAGVTKPGLDGLSPQEQLDIIAIRVRTMVDRQYRCFNQIVRRDLSRYGIRLRAWEDLDEKEQQYLREYFDEQVFPLLTPKALTGAPGHPFPHIEDLLLSLTVMLRDEGGGPVHFAHLGVADTLPRFVRLPESDDFVPIEQVIRAHVGIFYPGREVLEVHPFRVTRMGDLELDEQVAADFARAIEDELRRRPTAPVVRIEVERNMPKPIRELLVRELRFEDPEHGSLSESDVYEVDGLIDLGGLSEIADLPHPDLHYPPFEPRNPMPLERSVFDIVSERDVLVHHPYDSFETTFERFIQEAADDPDVVAIKLTLYRPGGPSVIGDALVQAAQAGKDVAVFVELKARFDEQRNILWARQLQRAGIHVVTGLVKFKTHAKIALVVRRESGQLKRYAHIGTGNYNRRSARQYTDLGLFTADPDITADLHALFNELTGSPEPPRATFKRLIVAPTNMLRRFHDLIEREAEHARAGRPARIRAKLNALGDGEIVGALYRAAQAGVNIDLIVRGFCTLRPGVPGLSERIRVVSILGRFLEHARIYAFENGGDPEYYIGSADWRPRNLRRRVEVAAPILAPECRQRLDHILTVELEDPTAWELKSDGSYERFPPPTGVDIKSAQEVFLEEVMRHTASRAAE